MKVSNLGLENNKITNIDEQFPVQDVLFKSGQITQYSSGIYAYGHIPFLIKEKIKQIINEEFYNINLTCISLPTLQPEAMWEKSGRLEKYTEEGLMFRCLTDKGNFCMAPTGEEAVVEFAQNKLKSYRDLPVTFYQIGDKFRNEIRARGYLLRGKSFEMMDAYSFGKDKKDLDEDYEKIKKAYFNIFKKLDLDVFSVSADSGSIGGNKSEEFMIEFPYGEDTVMYNKETKKAFNIELLEKENADEILKNTYGITDKDGFVPIKTVELGHIFNLSDKYSKSMNATFVDENGENKFFEMGCYGIGVSRVVAMIYEKSLVSSGKDFSFVLPTNLMPYSIYMVAKTDDKEILEIANNTYYNLENAGIKVLYDDRENVSIGSKIKDNNITGCPYLVVFGNSIKDGYVELENNKTKEKRKIKLEDFADECCKL